MIYYSTPRRAGQEKEAGKMSGRQILRKNFPDVSHEDAKPPSAAQAAHPRALLFRRGGG